MELGKGKEKPQISTIVEVDSDRVSCTGETNDHPKSGIPFQKTDMCNVGIAISCS